VPPLRVVIDEAKMLRIIREHVKRGQVVQTACRIGCTSGHLYRVLRGQETISAKLAAPFGYTRRIMYERNVTEPTQETK
jgi:hypothetical protein